MSMKTDDIRRLFLDFFRSKGHEIVPSDCLVPKDDPTLLFTGAGMNQFKEKFLGRNITYSRAATCQKCLRTGDLENVGRTSGHHTFFEMLGNFSFGDYFKKEAAAWAWEFLTRVLKIDAGRLWVSVYKDDDEACAIWKDAIGVPAARIIKFGEKENFWPSEAPTKGPNGPCGPCSEIFYDYGADTGCGKAACAPACDCGRFIEVWNLVFTQFDRQPDGKLKPLPSKNIDTGMGLERLASVMQGVRTNFEIDIFTPITGEIKRESGQRLPDRRAASRINAIADHIRAITFTIADGVIPSNEGRGYVVRKLIRRASRHAKDIGVATDFLYKLVSIVVNVMSPQYPELLGKRDDIASVVKEEEGNFRAMVVLHSLKLDEAFRQFAEKDKGDENKLAELAFNFYDTYGIPYDILEYYAANFKLTINKIEFDRLLDKQRIRSRTRSKIKGEIFTETFAKKIEALGLNTEFLGYEAPETQATVLGVLEGGEVILDKTPFYGESGGQVGDRGRIETKSGVMEVEDAKRIGDTIVHIGKMIKGKIAKGESARAIIDEMIRKKIMANHTATHLLQAALRKVLGEHVHQTGSLVDADHMRFDFTHMKKMEAREISRVEELVNDSMNRAIRVVKEVKDIDAAKREGAIALFGEKYSRSVRVVSIEGVSKELCGGTHVENTKDIGFFKITGESSIASGVRRIEALTGSAGREWVAKQKETQISRLDAERRKDEEKKMGQKRLSEELEKIDSVIAKSRDINGVKCVSEVIEGVDIETLRALSDSIISKAKSTVAILATRDGEKTSFIIAVTADLASKGVLKANDLARRLAELLGGSGGGRDIFAQGGGRDSARLEAAMREISEIVAAEISQ